jgi:nucleoid-associated protein YgaU
MGAIGFEETRAAAHLALGRVFTARGSHHEALRQFDEACRLGANQEEIDRHREVALSGLSKQEAERVALHQRFRRLRWLFSGAAAGALAIGVMISPALSASFGRESAPSSVSLAAVSLSARLDQMELPDNTVVVVADGNGRLRLAGSVAASHRDQLLRDLAKLDESQDIDTTKLTVRPAPKQPPDSTYIVREGDSLWTIANRAYGRPDLWTAVYEHNKRLIQVPNGLKPGDRILLPPITITPR